MKLVKLIAVIFLFSSCGNNSDVEKTEVDSSAVADTVFTADPLRSSYEVVTQGYYVWDVDIEKKTLKKNPELAATNINADSVINGLNQQYENVLLEKLSIKKETINLRIVNSDHLTNQMGSTGAAQYIAQAVINLTSVPGIKYVHIDFEEGSHASPGTWSRKDFPGYIIIQ
jgi:hypothetical protein